jgi:hypothetical protein
MIANVFMLPTISTTDRVVDYSYCEAVRSPLSKTQPSIGDSLLPNLTSDPCPKSFD